MRSILLAVFTALPGFLFSQYTYEQLKVNFLASPGEEKQFTYQNLRLYPILARENFKKTFSDLGRYTPLEIALAQKKVRITEKQGSGSVNELTVENLSSDTVIVISGEIVKGGKQDRIIQKDLLLKPKSGKVNLGVFCVESGRWSYHHRNDKGDFDKQYTIGSMGLRKVVEKTPEQAKVWSKVDEVNAKNRTETDTRTYTAIDQSADFKKNLSGYLSFFTNALSHEQDLMGVVVVVGDKVIGCDMFASPALFKQHADNLLHAYATEAILNGKPVRIEAAAVKSYMDDLLSSEKKQEETLKAKGTKFETSGKKIRVTSFD